MFWHRLLLPSSFCSETSAKQSTQTWSCQALQNSSSEQSKIFLNSTKLSLRFCLRGILSSQTVTSKCSSKAVLRSVVDKCSPDVLKLPTTRQELVRAQRFPTGRSESVQQTAPQNKGLDKYHYQQLHKQYTLVWLLFANKTQKKCWWKKLEKRWARQRDCREPCLLFSTSSRGGGTCMRQR